MCHVHQDSLGQQFRASPSRQDYEQIETYLREEPTVPRSWGVVTKSGDRLHMGIFYSSMQHGQPHHDRSLYVSEEIMRVMARPHQQEAA